MLYRPPHSYSPRRCSCYRYSCHHTRDTGEPFSRYGDWRYLDWRDRDWRYWDWRYWDWRYWDWRYY